MSGTGLRRLDPRIRPLTEAERRLLRCRIREYERSPGALERSVTVAGIGVTGVLWLLTLLASDLSWLVVTAVWLVIGVLIHFWVLRDLQKELGHLPAMAGALESALDRAAPDRVIAAGDKWELWEIPAFPGVVRGSIDRLEECLRAER